MNAVNLRYSFRYLLDNFINYYLYRLPFQGWVPVFVDGAEQRMSVMSIGFLLKNYDNDAIVWRGPKKNAMVKQFITDVCWGELDYLIVDTPPGTSDEHISIVEAVQVEMK